MAEGVDKPKLDEDVHKLLLSQKLGALISPCIDRVGTQFDGKIEKICHEKIQCDCGADY